MLLWNKFSAKLYSFASKILRTTSITKRFVILFVLICTIPMLVISLYSSVYYRNSVTTKVLQSSRQALHSLNKYISVDTQKYLDNAYIVITDEMTQQALQRYVAQEQDSASVVMAINSVLSRTFWSQNYSNMIVTDSDCSLLFSLGFTELDQSYRQKCVDLLAKSKQNHCWTSTKAMSGDDVVVLTKKIYSAQDSDQILGYIHFVFYERMLFKRLYNKLDFGTDSTTFLVGSDMHYLSLQHDKSKHAMSLQDENPQLTQAMEAQERGSISASYGGKQCLLVWEKNSDTNWYLVTAIPDSYVMSDIYHMILTTVAVTALILLLCIGAITLICSTIIIPVKQLTNYSNSVAAGNYDVQIENSGNDEITQLLAQQKTMVDKLVSLMSEIKQNSLRQRQLELQMLQSQINPHFVFNTLNVFKTIAELNEVTAISNGIGAFSGLLRQTIVNKNETISLRQELKNVSNYLLIQEYKYIGDFTSTYDADESTLDFLVPRLFLQPLVENSIMHGLVKGRLLNITISCKDLSDCIVVTVSDDGKGFAINTQKTVKPTGFTSIGMSNVRERLMLTYGINTVFEVDTELGKYTTVTMKLPKRKESPDV